MFGDRRISQEAYNSLYNVIINIISAINGLRDEIKALNNRILKLEKLLENKED